MGEIVEFPSNGATATGYLATPTGAGPGLVVVQEWWGMVDHIQDVCDRFAAEGFTALAPDLYHGVRTTEPDEAGKLMMAMNAAEAARDMSGAVDHLLQSDAVRGDGVGVVGYCMGGGLALVLACHRPDAVKACVPYYGLIPWSEAQPDWSQLRAAVQGHYAGKDEFFSPDKVEELERMLKDHGVDVQMFVYRDAGHAFFNDTRPEAYDADAAREAWTRTLSFFREHLG